MTRRRSWLSPARAIRAASFLVPALALLGCGSDSDDGPGSGSDDGAPLYAVSSVVFGPEESLTYVNLLPSLEAQTLDYDVAVERPGWADMWVHDGHVYISDGDSPIVTKFSIGAADRLVADETVSFADYGEVDGAFWSNTFVAPDKAYMINGVAEYVIWNPQTMLITGTLALPALEQRGALLVRAGTTDRANVIRDGKLYQPMYWSDQDYARFAPDSKIAVIDIATDTVVDLLDAPCPGLDVGARDEAGNLYFSTWTGGVYAPLALGDAPNCVVRIAAGSETAEKAFDFGEITAGREGAAVRHVGGGRLVFSVFHDERVDLAAEEDPFAALGQKNWRLWSYDPDAAAAAPLESVDWNSGAIYTFQIDERPFLLIPGTDYASTALYGMDANLEAQPLLDLLGWGIRAFRVR